MPFETIDDDCEAEIRRLRFADPEVEAEFRADADRKAVAPLRRILALSVVVTVIHALVDDLARPEARLALRIVRFGILCPLALGLLILSARPGFRRWVQAASGLFGTVACGVLVLNIVWTHPGMRGQFSGLLIASLLIVSPNLELRFPAALALITITFLAYWSGAVAAGGRTPQDLVVLFIGGAFGLVATYSSEVTQRTGFHQRRLIQEKSRQLGEALLEVQERRLEAEDSARRDPLTTLANRRHFYAAAAEARANTLAVIILDIDHFKAVNDTHGHAAGDRVLHAVAAVIRENVRPGDTPCRYGGEEFAVLLPGTGLLGAATLGERLRARIGAESIATEHGPLSVSVSVGIAAADGEAAAVDALLDRADQALYQAKDGGRDRVRLWHPEDARAQRA